MQQKDDPPAPRTFLPEPQRVGSARGFLRFAYGYWAGSTGRTARTTAAAIGVLLAMNLSVSIALNNWHRWFFDMLERRDGHMLLTAVAVVPGLILLGAACAVAMVKCSMSLQLSWRQWVTEQLISAWSGRPISDTNFRPGEDHGSTGYRIVQDVRLALDPIVDLTIGFCNALIQGVTFIAILVVVGGSVSISVLGREVTIPGYLAITALLYAFTASTAMYFLGKPLVSSVADKNEAESQFLFEMTSVAESTIRKGRPDATEHSFQVMRMSFQKSVDRWKGVIRQHCRLTWLINSNSFFTPIIPLLLAAPKYIDGKLTLGAVIQIAAAFTIVLGVLNWFTDNYIRLAEWSASAKRVDELRLTLGRPSQVFRDT